jgi:[ribosomal protein S5]-alanine N-acetyltransferase
MCSSGLLLVNATLATLDAAIDDPPALSALLAAELAEGWVGFPEALPRLRRALALRPDSEWATVFFVLEEPRVLVGMGGYKDEPTAEGVVEIGYAIAPAYRGRGLATQAARALVERAFADREVAAVDAHTLGFPSASTRVLEKIGFERIAEASSSEHGPLWHWRIAAHARGRMLDS